MAGTFHKCLVLYSTMYVYFSICTKTQGLERVWCLLFGCFCNMLHGSHIGDSTPLLLWVFPLLTPTPHYWPGGDVMSGCYHLQSRYLYQFTWIHLIALNLLGKRDRQLNTMASLRHHYGTWNWSSWYFLQLQMDFCPLENCGSLSFPSLISLLLFVAFRVPSAMWGICGRQWAEQHIRSWGGPSSHFNSFFGGNLERNIFKFPTISCNYWCFSVSNMTLVEVETHAGELPCWHHACEQ